MMKRDVIENNKELLHKSLSYGMIGCAFMVHQNLGSGHKESLYQEAFAEELGKAKIGFEREKSVKIFYPGTGKLLKSTYRPDFIVESKIIVEIKAVMKLPKYLTDQLYDYLRNSEYELGYLLNFSEPSLNPIRIIYSNVYKKR